MGANDANSKESVESFWMDGGTNDRSPCISYSGKIGSGREECSSQVLLASDVVSSFQLWLGEPSHHFFSIFFIASFSSHPNDCRNHQMST